MRWSSSWWPRQLAFYGTLSLAIHRPSPAYTTQTLLYSREPKPSRPKEAPARPPCPKVISGSFRHVAQYVILLHLASSRYASVSSDRVTMLLACCLAPGSPCGYHLNAWQLVDSGCVLRKACIKMLRDVERKENEQLKENRTTFELYSLRGYIGIVPLG